MPRHAQCSTLGRVGTKPNDLPLETWMLFEFIWMLQYVFKGSPSWFGIEFQNFDLNSSRSMPKVEVFCNFDRVDQGYKINQVPFWVGTKVEGHFCHFIKMEVNQNDLKVCFTQLG